LAALALLNRSGGAAALAGEARVMGKVDRLRFAKIGEGEGEVVPGYEADNKDYVSLSLNCGAGCSSS
jgi:hypothetical protein